MPGIKETEEEFHYRLRNPDDFDQESFRRKVFKTSQPQISAIFGHLKGEETMTLQALRFPKDQDWKKTSVETWVDDNKESLHCDRVQTLVSIWCQAGDVYTRTAVALNEFFDDCFDTRA